MAQPNGQPATLTSLSSETLLSILESVAEDPSSYPDFPSLPRRLPVLRAPVCKAVLPAARTLLYRDVRLRSFDQVVRFAHTVVENPSLGAKVKELFINVGWAFEGRLEAPIKEEKEPPEELSVDLVRKMLDALVNVEEIVVVGSSVLAQATLEASGSEQRFQRLRLLTLHSTFEDFPDPFHPSHFTSLHHFPRLELLNINCERDPTRLKPHDDDDAVPPASCPRLTGISFSGPLAECDALDRTIEAFPSLNQLFLRDTTEANTRTWAIDLLSHVQNPSLLEALLVNRTHDFTGVFIDRSTQMGSDITPFLFKCPNLRFLSIGGKGMAALKPAFYTAISSLPRLTSLHFGLHLRNVATADLSKVIKEKKPPLTRLTLDHIADDKLAGIFPEWTRRFTPGGLKKLLKLAEKEGVEVEGDVLWALHRDPGVPMADMLELMPKYKASYLAYALDQEQMLMEGELE
ncbi:hypothetical protein JCM6882_005072 [Rhodosporidiobolus microsporus]